MTSVRTGISILGVAFAAALSAVACDNNNGPSGSGTLSQAQADTVGDVMASVADGLAEGATYAGAAGPSMDFFASALPRGVDFPVAPLLCTPTRSPTTPSNGDGDVVPDSVRFDFSGCTLTATRFSIVVSGMIDYVDPTPTTTDIALKTRYLNFMRTITFEGKTRSFKQNGVRLVIRSTDKLQRADSSFRTDYTFPDGSTASQLLDWNSLFTPDGAGTVTSSTWRGWSLPSGKWTINGKSTFQRGGQNYSLTVTTSTPLHFNAACTMAPRLDAGSLTVVVVKNGTTTTLTITFTACGTYQVTRS